MTNHQRGGVRVLLALAALGAGCDDPLPKTPPPPPTVLEPADFQSPLIHLQRVQGAKSHLHIAEIRYRPSDKLLFDCSYTFDVVDAADPANMSYKFEGMTYKVPNDTRSQGCIHNAWDQEQPNIIYTTHHGNISNPTFVNGWDLNKTDPTDRKKLVQLPVLQEPGISYGGIDTSANGNIYIALHKDGLGVYRRNKTTNVLSRLGIVGGFTNAWSTRAIDDNKILVTDGAGGLKSVDVSDPANPKIIGSLAIKGVSQDLVINGSTLFVAAGDGGLVSVDISDLANMKIIGTADMPGSAVAVAYTSGMVHVAAWNDIRSYNVWDPAQMKFIGAARMTVEAASGVTGDPNVGRPEVTARTLGIAAWGDAIFSGNWYLLHSYRVRADRVAPYVHIPEDSLNLIEFGPTPVGSSSVREIVVSNEGTAPLTLYRNRTIGDPFTIEPAQVRIPPNGKTTLKVTYKATSPALETGFLSLMTDDPDRPLIKSQIVGNTPGIGVGKTMPPTQLHMTDGSDYNTKQGEGKVMLLAYFATF